MEIERDHAFNYKGEKIIVKFPNVGQLIDMESMKQALTNNRYGAMAASGAKSMYLALDLVDAISFLQIMCPKIKRMLGGISYTEMSPIGAKELVSLYKEEILPWYSDVSKELYLSTEPEGGEDGSGNKDIDSEKDE